MKKNSIIGLCLGLLTLSATSCSDMLSPDMSGRANIGLFGTDTVYSYLGIMKSMQNIAERQVILGESRGDLVSTTEYVTDSVNNVASFNNPSNGSSALVNRGDYYKVINQCNLYLHNVDTAVTKNNVKYMQKEYAQVVTMRAWAYMMLVQNYGRVPFITDPVTNSNTGWETNPPKGWATVDNLLDLLEGSNQELTKAVSIERSMGLPSYGTYNTGAVSIASRNCMFPSQLVLADLYLLRGKDVSDFEKAAQYYYDYLDDNSTRSSFDPGSNYAKFTAQYNPPHVSYIATSNGYATSFTSYDSQDLITMIPSAANSSLGTVLTSVQNTFGFSTSSSQSTSTSVGDDNTESYETSGSITVTADNSYRQLAPSNSYITLNKVQTYLGSDYKTPAATDRYLYYTCGDARLEISAPEYRIFTNNTLTRNRFVAKHCMNSSFHYALPMYRTTMVLLRFAEAINRAGYPEYAFSVLRNGLNSERIAQLTSRVDTVRNAEGKITALNRVYAVDSMADQMYATPGELRRAQNVPWLDFSEEKWAQTAGVHARGGSVLDDNDTMYTYQKMVAQKIADEESRVSPSSASMVKKLINKFRQTMEEETLPEVVDEEPAKAKAVEINAVEDIIVDELALESAFEGYRYYDLMRIARHKNNNSTLLGSYDQTGMPAAWTTSDFGTRWMAWKIARRGLDLTSPYENPSDLGDASLYNKLLDQANWYLANPVY